MIVASDPKDGKEGAGVLCFAERRSQDKGSLLVLLARGVTDRRRFFIGHHVPKCYHDRVYPLQVPHGSRANPETEGGSPSPGAAGRGSQGPRKALNPLWTGTRGKDRGRRIEIRSSPLHCSTCRETAERVACAFVSIFSDDIFASLKYVDITEFKKLNCKNYLSTPVHSLI